MRPKSTNPKRNLGLILKISLMLCFVLTMLDSKADSFVIKSGLKHLPTDIAATKAGITDDNGDLCAIIKVKTDLTDLRFKSNLGVLEAPFKEQEYWVFLSPGEKLLTVQKTGFISLDIDLTLPIRPGDVFEIVITSERTEQPNEVAEFQRTGKVGFSIQTQPPGAHVIIKGVDMGQTPFFSTSEPGWLHYTIESPYYLEIDDSVLVDPRTPLIEKDHILTPNFGWVNVSSEPEQGAFIEINGANTNYLTPRKKIRLPAGKHTIDIGKEKYRTKRVEITIKPGETVEVKAILKNEFALVSIEINPPDAELWIDNKIIVIGRFEGSLQKGSHVIKAIRQYYDPEERFLNLDLDEDSPDPIKITLKRQKGSLSVSCTPDASFTFQGREYNTPYYNPEVEAGEYEVKFRKEGYVSSIQMAQIEKGKPEYVIDTLRNTVNVMIETNPPGSQIFVNARHAGTTPIKLSLQLGDHLIQFIKPGYFDRKETITVESTSKLYSFDLMNHEVCPVSFIHEGDTYGGQIIGRLCWMTENLNAGLIARGRVSQSDNGILEKYCIEYDPRNCEIYGGLYSWDEAMAYGSKGAQGICPDGWHIPTDFEWMELESIADSNTKVQTDNWFEIGWRGTAAGSSLKNNKAWKMESILAEAIGFDALPSGYVSLNPSHAQLPFAIGKEAYFWTSTSSEPGNAWCRSLSHKQVGVNRRTTEKTKAYSVRCVRNMPEGYSP